jgi:hypothetical protein
VLNQVPREPSAGYYGYGYGYGYGGYGSPSKDPAARGDEGAQPPGSKRPVR